MITMAKRRSSIARCILLGKESSTRRCLLVVGSRQKDVRPLAPEATSIVLLVLARGYSFLAD